MTNNVLVKYSGGSNRRAISLGAFIEVRAAADAAVANLKAAVRSYTDLVRSGVAGDCDVRCVSDCLHLSAVNRLVARIREAQAVAPGALRRLAEVGLDVAVDAETKRALALRPADFVRVDHEWLDTASCAEVEAAARALGVRSPTGKDSRYHVTWLPEPEYMEAVPGLGLDEWDRVCSRCVAIRWQLQRADAFGSAVHLVARRGSVQAAA